MSRLPGNVARDDVELLHLDSIPYSYATTPAPNLPRAWSKFEETERRATMFEWAIFVLPRPIGNVKLLEDFASAYLLSFETVFQVLEEELDRKGFWQWLESHPAYDFPCRGMRTLRLVAAHIGRSAVAQNHRASVATRFAGVTTGGTTVWCWTPLAADAFVRLKWPKIDASDLDRWNEYSAQTPIFEAMRHGLESLRRIFRDVGEVSDGAISDRVSPKRVRAR